MRRRLREAGIRVVLTPEGALENVGHPRGPLDHSPDPESARPALPRQLHAQRHEQ
jgi:hypothetical protein